MQEGQEAGLAFVSFLRASKVPESLWEQLLEKIDRGELGCRGYLEVCARGQDQPICLDGGASIMMCISYFGLDVML